ncbi:NAD(P)/FAD-dependent oxidoreductase [Leeuwenhoekiella polynyae]|uniref:Flavin-dependent dehydrogenase n=1 Tax=Leeuwenhoekiella polynyae TaxID=1550906 RepID=A0A4Q0PGV3_9FLAO|nr:NAD(P)/FAD-dependent oxidoreductase [Leeuwenhoekiella polynyae]RXG26209.1 flavin-dependent dehydrogenase [Leeuwenhoekiella polynyae]
MKKNLNIAILGGGLAGLTAAIHLKKAKYDVQVFEKERYPKHKVCGEYLSNEIIPYWQKLGVDPFNWGAVEISELHFTTSEGKNIKTALPLGGFGISRYMLDSKMAEVAQEAGCKFIFKTVESVVLDETFTIKTQDNSQYKADLVIGSFGKRSNLDISLSRKFMKQKSPWLGVKMHYKAKVNSQTVQLHNFEGGYCGISQVEDNSVNVCYLTHMDAFKKWGNLNNFQNQVLRQNPYLDAFFSEATPLFEKPLSISQVSFQQKQLVENHVLMCGDSAGLIHPLCGNGMAMAVVGAKILSECIIEYQQSNQNRSQLETNYSKKWNAEFTARLRTGRVLQRILLNKTATNYSLKALQTFPIMMDKLIASTHGKPVSF